MSLPTEPQSLVHKKDCKCPICFTRPHTTVRNYIIEARNILCQLNKNLCDAYAPEYQVTKEDVIVAQMLQAETLSHQEKEKYEKTH